MTERSDDRPVSSTSTIVVDEKGNTPNDRFAIEEKTQPTVVDPLENSHQDSTQVDLERIDSVKEPIVKVLRSERRGLFANLAAIPEVTEPTHYPNSTKWLITFVVAIAAAAAPVGSAIILPSLDQVGDEFGSSSAVTNLTVALYMLSMSLWPLWWSSFSEASGRRTVYVISFGLFTMFGVLSAVSRNVAMLIVMRMMNGGAAASVQAVGAGTIADLWEPFERGRAMGFFFLGPLTGPLFAPIIGGLLAQAFDWRATQWALAVYGLIIWVLIILALPETLKARKNIVVEAEAASTDQRPNLSRISTRESVKQRSGKYAKILRILFVDPLSVLGYLRFPLISLLVYYSAITFGSLYMLNISIQYSYERQPYDFSTLIIGLLYIPNSAGYILGSIFGGPWMDRIMAREARKKQQDGEALVLLPEDRMRENALLGALLYPICLMVYGWTTHSGVIWVVPMIANFFYGVGSMLIFSLSTTMLTELFKGKSSSGVAVNNFVRNIFSCIAAIIGAPAIDAIGNGWLFTILGILALSSGSVIWLVKHYGPRWRKTMDEKLA